MQRNFLIFSCALALLVLSGCASTSRTIVGQLRPAISPASVRIYTTPPKRYDEIAILDATSGGSLAQSSVAGTEEAIQRLKEEAAALGANGVLLLEVGEQPGGSIGFGFGGTGFSTGRRHFTAAGGGASFGTPIMHKAARGIAIYVPDRR